MSFLKKLFGNRSTPSDDVVRESPQSELGELIYHENISIVVLLSHPLTRQDMRERLSGLPTLIPGIQFQLDDDPYTALMLNTGQAAGWSGEHAIALHLENKPLDADTAQSSIHLSNWESSMVNAMYDHEATLTLTYLMGEASTLDQLVLLYAVATALQPVGAADPVAHNAIPGAVLPDFFTAESLAESRQLVPTMLWTGIIKYQLPDQSVYYVSRGFHRFGVANLAFHGPFGSGETVMNLFDSLLNYQVSSGARLDVGHTSENSTQFMAFDRPIEEFYEPLSGGYPVLNVTLRPK